MKQKLLQSNLLIVLVVIVLFSALISSCSNSVKEIDPTKSAPAEHAPVQTWQPIE